MGLHIRLFFRQLAALTFHKNWIVLSNHWILNIFRCIILPIAFAVFLAFAQDFLVRPSDLGLGSAVPISQLKDVLNGGQLIWTDTTDGTGSLTASQIMSMVTKDFSHRQLGTVNHVSSLSAVDAPCNSNWNGKSSCFAAVIFTGFPNPSNTSAAVSYTIRGDADQSYVNVGKHTGDYEKKVLPLQWAIDSAIIEAQTGVKVPTPLEQPFTNETNESQKERTRVDFVALVDELFVIAYWLFFTGVAYQIAGAIAVERATLLTTHLQAMGCLRSARIISWHISISFPYLPAWVIAAIVWHSRMYTHTNVGTLILINIVTGFSLASWSLFIATPFGKSPQLAAIVTTGLAFALAIIGMIFVRSDFMALLFTLFFPPAYFIFAAKAAAEAELVASLGWDNWGSNNGSFTVAPATLTALVSIFLYPLLALWLEHAMYDAKPATGGGWFSCCRRRSKTAEPVLGSQIAIEVKNLSKKFNQGKKKEVVAIDDLSLSIPKNGVYVVLGSNGSGKSTLHGIIANILSPTSGSITFSGSTKRPAGGNIGIVPQKNVLFPELTCFQTVRLWSAIKRPTGSASYTAASLEQLLVDCDLAAKVHARSGEMSGGQKRKLQLAIGLVGGSEILLVDEATSGVDPLSRRAIWRALCAVRDSRTIIFTTHFLDEADLLGDDIAILAAPGKLLAHGPPVALKSTLGKGYVLHTVLDTRSHAQPQAYSEHVQAILNRVLDVAPQATMQTSTGGVNVSFELGTADSDVVASVLAMIEKERQDLGIIRYDTHGTSLEEVFLGLMEREDANVAESRDDLEKEKTLATTVSLARLPAGSTDSSLAPQQLSDGRRISPFAQAWVIFLKRLLVAKRSWLGPVLALASLLCAGCIPLSLMKKRNETCAIATDSYDYITPFYLPFTSIGLVYPSQFSYLGDDAPTDQSLYLPILSPPNVLASLNSSFIRYPTYGFNSTTVPDGMTFEQDIALHYRNLTVGGISVDFGSRQALFAYEAEGYRGDANGPVFLNTISNVLSNQIQGTTGPRIVAQYSTFPATFSSGLGDALKWIGFFGLGLAAFPAFFTLYVTRERMSSVKAMQLSNGLTPAGHHLGHLLAEMPVILIGSTILIVVWSVKATIQFADLGLMWFIFVLYGMASALFAFAVSMLFSTPLIAFAVLALFNLLLFILYVAAYLLTFTYAPPAFATGDTQIIHFTTALLSPLPSILRAVFVSINIFSLRCDGKGSFTKASPGDILQYGGPILYLILYIIGLLAFLIWADSGYPLPLRLSFLRRRVNVMEGTTQQPGEDVAAEARRVAATPNDPLRVLNVSKHFKGAPVKAVDDVSFGVGRETLGLLGPNGAGKTTTFNMIRGGVTPDQGDAFINGLSIKDNTNGARVSLGVCPQFTAIDSQLTVKDHLQIYGRLKGLSGKNLERNVATLLEITSLVEYTNRLASKLSGGNQRKLSLAISLMGNPSVLLIDEYSTGIDPATKRHMWTTLRNLSAGKAVVITTHSMEEAGALSDRVAILSGKLLAIGTVEDLVSRHPCYEIHVNCRTAEDQARTQQVLSAAFPDSRRADDVATRWEIPVSDDRTLSSLFSALSQQDLPEYAVERLSLESVFLKTIRNNEAGSEAAAEKRKRFWGLF